MSTINILSKSYVVPAQALPLSKAGGDQNIPEPKADRDHNVPQYKKESFQVGKQFMEAIVFTNTPWPIISNEKYSMIQKAWKLVIETQDRQRAFAGAPLDTPSVCGEEWLVITVFTIIGPLAGGFT